MDSKMKRSWEGLGVILANLGGLGGSFSSHFGGPGGSRHRQRDRTGLFSALARQRHDAGPHVDAGFVRLWLELARGHHAVRRHRHVVGMDRLQRITGPAGIGSVAHE